MPKVYLIDGTYFTDDDAFRPSIVNGSFLNSSTPGIKYTLQIGGGSPISDGTSISWSITPQGASTFYWRVYDLNVWGGQILTDEEIISGDGAHVKGSSELTSGGVQTFLTEGLVQDTPYILAGYLDNYGILSDPVAGNNLVRTVFTFPNITVTPATVGSDTVSFGVTTDYTGTANWVLVRGGTYPDDDEVLSGEGAAYSGNVALVSGVEQVIEITGLTPDYSYMLAVIQDNNGSHWDADEQILITDGLDEAPEYFEISTFEQAEGSHGIYSVSLDGDNVIATTSGGDPEFIFKRTRLSETIRKPVYENISQNYPIFLGVNHKVETAYGQDALWVVDFSGTPKIFNGTSWENGPVYNGSLIGITYCAAQDTFVLMGNDGNRDYLYTLSDKNSTYVQLDPVFSAAVRYSGFSPMSSYENAVTFLSDEGGTTYVFIYDFITEWGLISTPANYNPLSVVVDNINTNAIYLTTLNDGDTEQKIFKQYNGFFDWVEIEDFPGTSPYALKMAENNNLVISEYDITESGNDSFPTVYEYGSAYLSLNPTYIDNFLEGKEWTEIPVSNLVAPFAYAPKIDSISKELYVNTFLPDSPVQSLYRLRDDITYPIGQTLPDAPEQYVTQVGISNFAKLIWASQYASGDNTLYKSNMDTVFWEAGITLPSDTSVLTIEIDQSNNDMYVLVVNTVTVESKIYKYTNSTGTPKEISTSLDASAAPFSIAYDQTNKVLSTFMVYTVDGNSVGALMDYADGTWTENAYVPDITQNNQIRTMSYGTDGTLYTIMSDTAEFWVNYILKGSSESVVIDTLPLFRYPSEISVDYVDDTVYVCMYDTTDGSGENIVYRYGIPEEDIVPPVSEEDAYIPQESAVDLMRKYFKKKTNCAINKVRKGKWR